MFKNVADQYIFMSARDIISDAPKTGDAGNITINITGDNGALAASSSSVSELDATNAPGVYKLALTQAETNADSIVFAGLSTTAGVEIVPLIIQTQSSDAQIAGFVWDEVLTGATHNIPTSAGRRLRQLATTVTRDGTAQGPGAGTNQIQLDSGASSVDGTYDPSIIRLTEGTTGGGQARLILEYHGATRTATLDRDWKVLPDNTSEFVIFSDAGRDSVNEGLATAGTASTITLNALASSSDDAYKNQNIQIRSGTGADQVRRISAYNGMTRVATVSRDWDDIPDTTTGYVMLPDACKEIQAINGTELTDKSGTNWLTFFDNADTLATLTADDITFLKNVIEGDMTVDTTTTPWQMVIKIKGTSTELIRKDLKTTAAADITSDASIIGQKTEPA